jgi:hypothetical protein
MVKLQAPNPKLLRNSLRRALMANNLKRTLFPDFSLHERKVSSMEQPAPSGCRLQRSSKFQIAEKYRWQLGLPATAEPVSMRGRSSWSLELLWDLELGVWSFVRSRSPPSTRLHPPKAAAPKTPSPQSKTLARQLAPLSDRGPNAAADKPWKLAVHIRESERATLVVIGQHRGPTRRCDGDGKKNFIARPLILCGCLHYVCAWQRLAKGVGRY